MGMAHVPKLRSQHKSTIRRRPTVAGLRALVGRGEQKVGVGRWEMLKRSRCYVEDCEEAMEKWGGS